MSKAIPTRKDIVCDRRRWSKDSYHFKWFALFFTATKESIDSVSSWTGWVGSACGGLRPGGPGASEVNLDGFRGC